MTPALLRRVERLLAAHEFRGRWGAHALCPECHGWHSQANDRIDHKPDCELAAVLRDVREELAAGEVHGR